MRNILLLVVLFRLIKFLMTWSSLTQIPPLRQVIYCNVITFHSIVCINWLLLRKILMVLFISLKRSNSNIHITLQYQSFLKTAHMYTLTLSEIWQYFSFATSHSIMGTKMPKTFQIITLLKTLYSKNPYYLLIGLLIYANS